MIGFATGEARRFEEGAQLIESSLGSHVYSLTLALTIGNRVPEVS